MVVVRAANGVRVPESLRARALYGPCNQPKPPLRPRKRAKSPEFPRYYRTYRSSLLVPAVRARASPPHHPCLPWGFLSGEDIDRTVLWYQENDAVAA